MQSVLLASFLALVGPCSAKPAERIAPQPLTSIGPSVGFPAEYLPSANFTDTKLNDLTLPISPQQWPGFQPVFDFDPTDPPVRGLQLVQSIVMNIDYPWRDLVNQPLMTETVLRPQPFFQFKFTTRPSMTQGTALTPQKVGLAYCWMLFTTLQRDSWPGHVRGVIFEGNNQRRIDVGSVRVDNDPNVVEQATAGPGATLPATADPNAAEPVPADPGADSTGGVSAWFRFEQRWARCFTTSLQLPIVHYPQHLVMDDPAFAPKPGIQTHRFPCRSSGLADRLDLFIYPAAYAPSPQQLTWDRMMKFLIGWNTKVAARREGGRITQFIDGNVLIAEISVYLQPAVGEKEWEGFSVAPA